ncbi:hypothetical protein Pelo_17233 [Pelomyxa schiedti]|nr:hypothetical protein Pelo_17233 [Pelomyxa schiedti]
MDQCRVARNRAIAVILQLQKPPLAAPNPHSMASYCCGLLRCQTGPRPLPPYGPLLRQDPRAVPGGDAAAPAPAPAPAPAGAAGLRGRRGGSGRGDGGGDEGVRYEEAREIQCVENRIKWFRQRKCVGWARGLMASGSCKTTASRSIAFLCGAHPRAGKDSPLFILGPDILASILLLGRGFNGSGVDGLQREPRQTEFEASLMACSPWDNMHKWPSSGDKIPVLAFGNFNPLEYQCGMAFYTAYTLLYELGPWVPLDDFVTAVEIGNTANLQCFSFFRSGAYFHTPQERFMAIRLHQTLFGSLTKTEESKFCKCFTGDGFVAMAGAHKKRVRDINIGDWVKTESGIKRVVKIEKKVVDRVLSMCNVSGVWLTPGHPVFMDGMWKHPFEITRVRTVIVDELFNFELSGGPMSPDHSVFINVLSSRRCAHWGKTVGRGLWEGGQRPTNWLEPVIGETVLPLGLVPSSVQVVLKL